MSVIKDNGGSAFPVDASVPGHNGMTLRDWFAGQALAGMLANPDRVVQNVKYDQCARYSYHFADAMIAERNK